MFTPYTNMPGQPSQALVAAAITALQGGDKQARRDLRARRKQDKKSEIQAIWERKQLKTQQSEEGFLS
jgi:hypothetical protein